MDNSTKKKPKLVIKKSKLSKKQIIESEINKKFKNQQLNSQYLEYDYEIDEQFLKTLPDNKSVSNYNKLDTIINRNIYIPDSIDDDEQEEHDQTIVNDNYIQDDLEDLDKHTIGNKIYYIDENKGLIYDTSYLLIGNIDDYGEINIDT